MLTHAAMLGAVAYLVMLYGLKQPAMMAENRSLILAAVALIYMINFGHKMPFQ
jgi:hypothetical protein